MTARVPRIGRLLVLTFALLAGCVPEYNPEPFRGETVALTRFTQLTGPNGPDPFDRAGQARLSPDGLWVVVRGVPRHGDREYGLFAAHARWAVDDHGDRHLVGLDRPVRITRVGLRCGGASISPDGFTLAFTAGPTNGPTNAPMRLYRVDGWQGAVAMTDVARGVDLAQHPVSPPALSVDDCDWSPTGKSIVVAASEGGGPSTLFSLRPDGSHPIRLGPVDARSPAFSPDGTRLAYRAGTPPQVTVAAVVPDVAGDAVGLTDVTPLTRESNVASTGPCWLADGRRIVYATTRHGDANPELYVMRSADGTLKTRLTRSPGVDLLPAVTPDGRHLIWTAARPADAAPQLFAADLTLPRAVDASPPDASRPDAAPTA